MPVPLVGRWFTFAEFVSSRTASRLGIENIPQPQHVLAMRKLCNDVLDPLRDSLGMPIRVTSGFRSPELNKALKGADHSQHMLGQAADIKVKGMTSDQIASEVLRLKLPFDQLIWYAPSRGGHVHVSISVGGTPRGEVLHAPADGGYTSERP